MPKFIDNFLNRTTMYRVALYYLIGLWLIALVFGAFGILPYQPLPLIITLGAILGIGMLANELFAWAFEIPASSDSVYITSFILALIITPPTSTTQLGPIMLIVLAPIIAMASKYILALYRRHIFNPAAFAVAVTGFAIGQYASWWVGGNLPLLPFVVLGGLLLVRKIQRFDLSFAFMTGVVACAIAAGLGRGTGPLTVLEQVALHTPLFFFAFVMITEPLTAPPTRPLRILYGALVGILFVPAVHIGGIYATPELALLAGNLFAYTVSPKRKLMLRLKEKVRIAEGVYEFVFHPDRRMAFRPGQYMEWTLGHATPDSRGNRRYFTIASSPTEDDIRIGVKFYPQSSTFKRALLGMDAPRGPRWKRSPRAIYAGQLAGDFTLPADAAQKLVFVAGGIGITPFRSMVKYLLDRGEQRDIALVYSNWAEGDIAYRDIFDAAERALGMRTIYTLTDAEKIPLGWNGERGYVTAAMIENNIPDWHTRLFYISGPRTMVTATERTLKAMGVHQARIKTDFFPGFA